MRWLSLSEHLASPLSVSLLIDCLLQRCRWLGQNSKQTKLGRQLGDIQIRMRLKVSGSRNEIRQEYARPRVQDSTSTYQGRRNGKFLLADGS